MTLSPIPSDEAFLAANEATAMTLRVQFPSCSDADLAFALRTAQWLMEPVEKPQEAEIASRLLAELFQRRLLAEIASNELSR